MMKIITLKVRLLRRELSPENAFTKAFAFGTKNGLNEYSWEAVDGGRLFIGQIYNNPPSWQTLLQEVNSNLDENIFTGGAGAVVFLPLKEGRFAAVCFGHIHIALNDNSFVRQFGLRVTLNSVPRDQLRTIDLATPDAVTFLKRVQASKDSDIQAFGVDKLRDLARVAGGTPRKTEFARFVAGKDSLSITCQIRPNKIHEKCAEIFSEYKKKTYRKEFAWVDNLQIIENKDTIKKLDKKVEVAIKNLRKGNSNDLHMTPPEIVNYTEGSILHYNGFGSKGRDFHSLSINDYINELNRCNFKGSFPELKAKHRIKAKEGEEGEFSEKWRVYECFVFETTFGTKDDVDHFILFAGDWYKVEKSFKKRIEETFDNVDTATIVGGTKCRNEQELIEDLENNRSDLIKLDGVKINPSGVKYAQIEPCDFFSDKMEFIHLKDGHSSGPISHLWSQGAVSAECFVSDEEFRYKLREKVKSINDRFKVHLPKGSEELIRKNYCVIYGIMRKRYRDGSIGLPFFSKVSLQSEVEKIRSFGIRVAIELIEKP